MNLNLRNVLLSRIHRHWPELPALIVVVVVVVIVLSLEIIPVGQNGAEGHENVRNLILFFAAAGALPFAVWRSRSGQRQADATQAQAEAAVEQTRVATLARLNDQFTTAATLLGHDSMSVRRLGLQSLQQLAIDHPVDYYVRSLRALCDYAREPFTSGAGETEAIGPHGRLRSDVQGAVQMIGKAWDNENARAEGLKSEPTYVPNLIDANLSKGRFWSLNLEGAHLEGAICIDAVFGNVKLKGADLAGTNLSGADLTGESIDDRGSRSPVHGLTQSMLNEACADPERLPKLCGVKDEESGEQLEWRGQRCPP